MPTEEQEDRQHGRRLKWGMFWLAVFVAGCWGLVWLTDTWGRAGQ